MNKLAVVQQSASVCTRCALAQTRTQVVFGAGDSKADLLFIGEAPGHNEDIEGEPFIGRSGKLLDTLVVEELGIDRSGYYISNVVKCRPPNNRDPRPVEIEACSGWLQEQLRIINPKVIVTVGNFATRTILGTKEGITTLRGRVHHLGNRLVVPTFHPAAALRGRPDVVAMMREDLLRAKKVIAGDYSEVPA